MRIHQARRISQIFFLAWFLWFCLASRVGSNWWEIRGWPVNWFLQLDPLAALGVALASGRLPLGFLWAFLILSLTLIFGRFFCGWLCPFGTIHHFMSWIRFRSQPSMEKIRRNAENLKGQSLKYLALWFFLGTAAGSLGDYDRWRLGLPAARSVLLLGSLVVLSFIGAFSSGRSSSSTFTSRTFRHLGTVALVLIFGFLLGRSPARIGTLQTGILDPIPFLHRSVTQVLFPILGMGQGSSGTGGPVVHGAWLLGLLFFGALFLNWHTPRFYCRYVCPLGALLGLVARKPLWKFQRNPERCTECKRCEADCQGGCAPSQSALSRECFLCCNCFVECPERALNYTSISSNVPSRSPSWGPTRRRLLVALGCGMVAAPVLRLEGLASLRSTSLAVRPPGSLPEPDFLKKCLKCGQCIRICPTGVLQPALWEAGIEGLWTPVLDFRSGSSGCQYTCVACSRICPTGAIRPITLDEKQGKGSFKGKGPVRIGLALVDRSRCLPWSLNRPCIVCEENCPVSPKAIETQTAFAALEKGSFIIEGREDGRLEVPDFTPPDRIREKGDLFVEFAGKNCETFRSRITDWGPGWIQVDSAIPEGQSEQKNLLRIVQRLQRPVVDPARCIGCGLCEHECPVRGIPAIRVTPENETRHFGRRLVPPLSAPKRRKPS